MTSIVIYSTGYCPYCSRAKQLLDSKGVRYDEIRVDENPALRDEMIHKSGRRTVPQIFINGQHVGGCDDLYALEQQGRLDKLLKG
ncbi:glutaredoxin [Legionella rubrilucens]|uniref:Glutaredoxin n=1 Tax=Legionella rubrilucens TaxID=458 RepID=A0A0W0XVI1_9GAMM|nr:glutaredoxin 3 [Legionella rubrilucens]KTD48629.1 glutaredoxin [Legionella rubrilucens]